jgi:hypothetical protein
MALWGGEGVEGGGGGDRRKPTRPISLFLVGRHFEPFTCGCGAERRKLFLISHVIGHDDYCKIMYWFYEPTAVICILKIFMVFLDFVLEVIVIIVFVL